MRERGLEPLWFYPLDPKSIKHQNAHCPLLLEITRNYKIIKRFPVIPVSVGVSDNRSHPERPGHKIDIRIGEKEFFFQIPPYTPECDWDPPPGAFTSTSLV